MIIAQLTDTHIVPPGELLIGQVDTAQRLEQAITALNAMKPRPDLVLLTGDLTDRGEPEAYTRLVEILAGLTMPYYVIPGNHDRRDRLRQAFLGGGYLPATGLLNYTIEHYPIRLIGLDTLIEGEAGGDFCRERAGWLDAMLYLRPDIPTIIFMHHPPFITGVEAFDQIGCRGADRLAALLGEHRQVEALLCGHHHQAIMVQWQGIAASVAPSTAHQIMMGMGEDETLWWNLPPPQGALHVWRRGAPGLISRTLCFGAFPGGSTGYPPKPGSRGARH